LLWSKNVKESMKNKNVFDEVQTDRTKKIMECNLCVTMGCTQKRITNKNSKDAQRTAT